MKKILLSFLLIIMLFTTTSCSTPQMGTRNFDESKLQTAFDRLMGRNYTAKMKSTITFTGSKILGIEPFESYQYEESSRNDVYIVEDEKDFKYIHIGEKIKKYQKSEYSDNWYLEETSEDNQFENYTLMFFNIDPIGKFTYFFGKYLGDCDAILAELMKTDEFETAFGEGTIDTRCLDYSLKLSGQDISELNVTFSFALKKEVTILTFKIKMNIEITNVGTTKVTIPENIIVDEEA